MFPLTPLLSPPEPPVPMKLLELDESKDMLPPMEDGLPPEVFDETMQLTNFKVDVSVMIPPPVFWTIVTLVNTLDCVTDPANMMPPPPPDELPDMVTLVIVSFPLLVLLDA